MKFANIIVDISLEKLDRTFQYRVPEELQGVLKEGMQVKVPFGNGGRTLSGYVLELTDTCEWEADKIKPILGLEEKSVCLEGQLIALAAWMRRTYGSTMNQALKTVLPVKKSVQEKISRKIHLAVPREEAEMALAKMERKVAAGADYFQTQAVFEPEKFIKFMEKAKQFGKPVQVGIIIPKSAGMAKFMNNNVAGIHVPDEMIEELKADKEKTKAGITGVEIAARIIKECKPYCQGVHIMALGWESKIPALLEQAEI